MVVAIRERVNFSRALIERLPKLRLIALVGRAATTIDYAACKDHGRAGFNRCEQCADGSGGTDDGVDPGGAAQHCVGGGTDAAWRVALHAVASSGWQHVLGIFGLGTIGSLVARAGAGLGMKVLAWGQQGSAAQGRGGGL